MDLGFRVLDLVFRGQVRRGSGFKGVGVRVQEERCALCGLRFRVVSVGPEEGFGEVGKKDRKSRGHST